MIDLKRLAETCAERDQQWPGKPSEKWSLADRGNELAGEAGELCNAIKKIRRVETGVAGNSSHPPGAQRILKPNKGLGAALFENAMEEIADVIICTVLVYNKLLEVADNLKIPMTNRDIEVAIADKYNKSSDKVGLEEFKINLHLPDPEGPMDLKSMTEQVYDITVIYYKLVKLRTKIALDKGSCESEMHELLQELRNKAELLHIEISKAELPS